MYSRNMIWNSLVTIHEVVDSQRTAIIEAAALYINAALPAFEDKFAPASEPPEHDDTMMQIVLDGLAFGLAVVPGAFIPKVLAKLPYFVAKPGSADEVKDTSLAFIALAVSVAKDLAAKGGDPSIWTPEDQNDFGEDLAQGMTGWALSYEKTLQFLFSGEDDAIDKLTALISDGKLIPGSNGNGEIATFPDPNDPIYLADHQAAAEKVFFGYAIPVAWFQTGHHPFVLDSGFPCGTIDPIDLHMTPDVQQRTWGCYDQKLYYLMEPIGGPKYMPPGLDSIDGKHFGDIQAQDMIQGAVRTYLANNNQNGASAADPLAPSTLQDLVDQDITTPGFFRFPVCSADKAFAAWVRGDSTEPNYPCSLPSRVNDCGTNIEDQTSSASPLVADCLQIVANLQTGEDPGEWTTLNSPGHQRELVSIGAVLADLRSKWREDGDDGIHNVTIAQEADGTIETELGTLHAEAVQGVTLDSRKECSLLGRRACFGSGTGIGFGKLALTEGPALGVRLSIDNQHILPWPKPLGR
ncbi:hypothetical protein B0T16DRAFT_383990 [Cercophora newfieldiana]|uniref:Ecp2 effector protein-like domain-containing protein n=1 Tax=Cercophora newfieldiana TaxID=92897 RepID=A0AA40CZK1_9PEZI|nr:hypothetical protein B0T16DRAFT_383990 [Cercophora newfieldiana]